jgi:hypothetical protein
VNQITTLLKTGHIAAASLVFGLASAGAQASRAVDHSVEYKAMSMKDDLAHRSPDIHWPTGFEPEKADLFAHNDLIINASCEPGPQSSRIASMLFGGKIKLGAVHTYLELFARYFMDLTPNVALIAAVSADCDGNLYTVDPWAYRPVDHLVLEYCSRPVDEDYV